MRDRPRGFLVSVKVEDPEVFDYVSELHEYLWRFVRCHLPGASGDLGSFLDDVLERAESGADRGGETRWET